MQKQKIKNIIIFLIVMCIGFLVFSKSSNKENVIETNENTQNQEEVLSNENTEQASGVLVPTNTQQGLTSAQLSQKFNTAMSNANSAFLNSDYNLAISYYNEALTYKKYEGAYSGLYNVYLAQKEWVKALDAVNNAIKINPLLGDPWKWKILVMDEGLKSSFSELKRVYEEGYPKVKTQEKPNLVTYFASLSAKKGEKAYAITLWQRAIEINPESKAIYQAEIDALNK